MTDQPRCAYCGEALNQHASAVRFQLPDELFALSATEREKLWLAPRDHADLATYIDRGFVRVLFPVHLNDGGSVTFGAWLEVTHDDFDRIARSWWEDAYRDLTVDGRLANAIQPWGARVLGRTCHAVVLDDSQIPYVVTTDDELLAELLTKSHDAAAIRSALPGATPPLDQ